ncbi:phospholipid-translocating P-type ATPase, flippase family protein [Histomonas meleagridis]|uniref:phospholipid-translocating P-type ATPase, flippase family protein n=1 Tax=Histomonas meleagridis TaxID=135588 RepID=UPI003559CC35|nr:phospholipid-translocating P-type ATPase, flippase family protein [Histomonas meleagridis]KAH0801309.1 phospholipid-translocating P-type ATPase, flippase family protein [Histomonas meleagridis]
MDESEGRTIIIHNTIGEKGKPIFVDNTIHTTKYTILTFLPKNLFEQFSRIANFYFLVVVALLNVPGVPISAAVAVLPLALVVGISAVREAIEDFMRYKSDCKINSTVAHKLENNQFVDIEWKNVYVGDIIIVRKDEQVPADMVLFSTNTEDGIAYIDTCNLDGETNLKVRQALQNTANITDPSALTNFQGTIKCDDINNLLYTFNGCLEYNGSQHPLDNKQVLLRGCVLRNTQFAIGVVVYTGLESKLMMNSSTARSKKSKLERGLNAKLISIFCFIFLWGIISTAIGFSFQKQQIYTSKHWYFFINQSNMPNQTAKFFILLVSNLVIINAMIPISLYVTLEIVRVFQALFVNWDAKLYDVENDVPANARTSNISDDLGQIEYIFSDKTGTLTRNVMEFMKCSISGHIYGSGTTEIAYAAAKRRGLSIPPPNKNGKAFQDAEFERILRNGAPMEIKHFIWLLAVCHSVIPEVDSTKPYGIAFQASSPDEAALVSAAADMGYVFKSRSPSNLVVSVKGEDINIEVMAVLEFTSERKRSSVIIRHPETNEIILYCKGADDLIFQKLKKDSPYQEETRSNLKQFAADGLRTLCCTYRVIDEDFYNDWAKRFHDANCAIQNRDELVNEVCNEIENDLILLGATAIEDKLQEGVPDTIESLLRAKINVWVITGDKRETAINIGFACSLLTGDMKLIILDTDDINELMENMNNGLNDTSSKLALIAGGGSLYHLLKPEYIDKFYELSKRCQSVICCRVSPLQKASIVKMMREKTGKLCLAIGDGANDVGMILEADVGCGISGKEGRQAVLASDYSFGQFRFLKRLLLTHGRLNFYRNVDLVNYSFYKNMCFSFCQIIFQFYSSFSGNTVYDSILYTVFNVFFTSVPPVIYAGLERDVSQDSMENIPELYYIDGRREWIQSYLRFWLNLLLGIVHALISFFVPYFGMYPFINSDGHSIDLSQFGLTVYGCVVLTVNLRIAFMCNYWTWLHHLFIWGSILIYPLVVTVVTYMKFSMLVYKTGVYVFKNSSFYFSVIGTAVLSIFPVVTFDAIQNSRNIITNRVLVSERAGKSGKKVRDEVKEFIPPDPELPMDNVYPDKENNTGYIFDEPANVGMYHTMAHGATNDDPQYDFKSTPFLRRKQVSTFGLDKL